MENFHVDLGTILLLLVFKSPVGTLVVILWVVIVSRKRGADVS